MLDGATTWSWLFEFPLSSCRYCCWSDSYAFLHANMMYWAIYRRYCKSLSFRGPQMNRFRLIDEVSIYLISFNLCAQRLALTKISNVIEWIFVPCISLISIWSYVEYETGNIYHSLPSLHLSFQIVFQLSSPKEY